MLRRRNRKRAKNKNGDVAKARGVKFGRPFGPGKSKLDQCQEEIVAFLKTGGRQNYIAKKYGTTPANLSI